MPSFPQLERPSRPLKRAQPSATDVETELAPQRSDLRPPPSWPEGDNLETPKDFLFPSNIFTKPRLSTLEDVIHTTLADSDFEGDGTTHALQAYVGHVEGHVAALLVLSGIMGSNQVAVRAALATRTAGLLRGHR